MLSLFFTFFVALFPLAHAETEIFTEAPLAPNPHRYEFKAEFNFISSNQNYLSGGGSPVSLNGGGKYSDALGVLQVSYDIDRYFRIYGGVSGGRADATGPDDITGNAFSNNTVGMDEGWLGAQYWFRTHGFSATPQLDLTLPFFSIDPNGSSPLLGEGATKVRGSLWLQLHYGMFTPFAYGGYEYRNGGRSSLLPYRAGLRFRQAGSGWVQGEFRGYATLTQDSNTANIAVREQYLENVNGGSFEFYSMNPNHGEFSLSGGFEIGEIGLYAAGAYSAFGRESAMDWTATVGITIGGKIFTEAAYDEDRPDRFQAPKQKYDEKLFRDNEEAPVMAPAEPDDSGIPEIREKPKPKPKKKRRLRPSPDGGPSPDVQLIMKDTQKALENKSK